MLIISRHRNETPKDAETAAHLAEKFNTVVQSVPLLYDFPADSSLIERLRFLPEPAYFLVPISCRSAKNILNLFKIPYAGIFETKDAVQIPQGTVMGGQVEWLDANPQPRWYPVIDEARCTACLECVNYCLFGVYTIGTDSRPIVDQPAACRDGCPACARVCPSGAIMFPLYEDPTIAGYENDLPDNLNDLVDMIEQIE